ncbi:MAG TPA: PQQ-dependent sugar dehydrogenase [Mucilaginibacter sp.]|jgi:glucose/arabinose dehydrogenase
MKKISSAQYPRLFLYSTFFAALLFLAVIALVLPSFTAIGRKNKAKNNDPETIMVQAQRITSNLQAPVALAFPGNGDIMVAEQTGKIRLIKNGKLIDKPVLDVSDKMVKVTKSYDERGLLGIVLSPKFRTDRKLYVFYSAPTTGNFNCKGVLAVYKMLPNSDYADAASGRVLFTVDKPEYNHDGGCLQFGPDGYLYFSLGDGGGAGDRHGAFGNGQKMDTWLGKILRIDVRGDKGYSVPKDNPFVNRSDAKPEIWAYGLRNPWKFSFDKATGQLFAGDVGQDAWEEVDIIEKGNNYGWRITEGNHCFDPVKGCSIKGITMPIYEYSHRDGISIIGGYVYNGKSLPALKSKYVFADWTGPLFYLKKTGNSWQRGKITVENYADNLKVTAFGEDSSGELYVLTNPDTGPDNSGGGMYKLVKN